MAITFVEALSGEANNGGNVTLNFSAAQSGDFAIVMGGHADTSSNAGVSTAGYTEIVDSVTGVRFSVSYKFLTSDTSVTCLGTGNGSDETSYVCFVFRGVNTVNPIDTASTGTTAGSGYPNSPSITTTTDNCVVISCFLVNENHSIGAGPSGYSNATAPNTASETNEATAGAAWKTITSAGAENPGQFVLSGSVPTHSWRAQTVALRTDVFGDGGLSSSGSAQALFVAAPQTQGLLEITGSAAADFVGAPFVSAPLSATGTGTASLVGDSLASIPVPFSMTGSGAASFVGAIANAGTISATGRATADFSSLAFFNVVAEFSALGQVQWVGATSKMESVREDIRTRGAATVNM